MRFVSESPYTTLLAGSSGEPSDADVDRWIVGFCAPARSGRQEVDLLDRPRRPRAHGEIVGDALPAGT
jgi:hypothetical protein